MISPDNSMDWLQRDSAAGRGMLPPPDTGSCEGDAHNNEGRFIERPVAGNKEMDDTHQATDDDNCRQHYPVEPVKGCLSRKGLRCVIAPVGRHEASSEFFHAKSPRKQTS
jgi:hypothetical protein